MNNDTNNVVEEIIDDELKIKAGVNEVYLDSKLFKKTQNGKYLKNRAESYETLAENILVTYYRGYTWGAKYYDKKLMIMNLICPNTLPVFSLVETDSFSKFTELVLGAGKTILTENDLDRKLSDEEFKERFDKALAIAEQYKD